MNRSPDGTLVATGSEDKTCRLWQLSDQRCLYILHWVAAIWTLQVFTDSTGCLQLAMGDRIGVISLWMLHQEPVSLKLLWQSVRDTTLPLTALGLTLTGSTGLFSRQLRVLEQAGMNAEMKDAVVAAEEGGASTAGASALTTTCA